MRGGIVNGDGWRFAVDVGGTFTDCVGVAPDGAVRSCKMLSSGVVRGVAGHGSRAGLIVDPRLAGHADQIYRGWNLRIDPNAGLAELSERTSRARVARITASQQSGRIEYAPQVDQRPIVGLPYELSCDLEAPLLCIRRILGLPLDRPLGAVSMRLGTTRGTNALLERRGARTALLITAGFADLPRIGDQTRPRLFDLHIRKPIPLFETVVEVNERIDAGGRVLRAPDGRSVSADLARLHAVGVQTVAICLLNSYRNSVHEQLVARLAREAGFTAISVSAELWPLQRIVPRCETTVLDAYLTPVVRDYLARVQAQLGAGTLQVMTSVGGLAPAAACVARDTVLSGPAGGVIAAAHAARKSGSERVIAFDMGGTSTDVSRFDGAFERRYETLIGGENGGTRIVAPLLAIETVAAGGGSVCDFDGAKPTVGPRSAGAQPGPACYGAGGPFCVTDANVLLGRVPASRFPFVLDIGAAERRLDALIERIADATGRRYDRCALAAGYVQIANAHMAAAIRSVSVRRGYDPREYVLNCCGGAGGQHVCALARDLGIRRVLVHPFGTVLSAFGIAVASPVRAASRDLRCRIDEQGSLIHRRALDEMEQALRGQLRSEGISEFAAPRRALELRYAGQDSTIPITEPTDGDWRSAFENAHRRLYGFDFPGRPIEARAAHVEVSGAAVANLGVAPLVNEAVGDAPATAKPRDFESGIAESSQPVWFDGEFTKVPLFERRRLRPGMELAGPAMICEDGGTIWLESDWRAIIDPHGNVILTPKSDEVRIEAIHQPQNGTLTQRDTAAGPAECDPVTLELFANHFAAIAEQMGATLQRTALSTNVKERLDFSCAVFDAAGDLVAHAPHIPVHLGAMGQCVRCMRDDLAARPAGGSRPGEVCVTNDPFRGGSHLPDVTVITPAYLKESDAKPAFFVANRAHHAEIGGISPGSMPPHSRTLADEGVLIPLTALVRVDRDGVARFAEAELRGMLAGGPHPSRSIDQNIADLRAQVAANQRGVALLRELCEKAGAEQVAAYMGHLQAAAARYTRAALNEIGDGVYEFTDELDDGARIAVRVQIFDGEAVFDFSGSASVHAGNLNATPAIVSSAALYCLRCLIGRDVPLNAGILSPVKIKIPPGLLNPLGDLRFALHVPLSDLTSKQPGNGLPAVVGGNVETSQRVVDVIFGALGAVAAGQGTMNNVAFGDAGFGYYETIGGGAGAGPRFDGADAVHVHMTNTRLTDPEVLEERYPVRLRRFAIRRGSGGAGQHRGGDGIVREIEFLSPLELSLITQRRTRPPFGMAGGRPGQCGENRLERASGAVERLASAQQSHVEAGDRLIIETPGGGGFGEASA